MTGEWTSPPPPGTVLTLINMPESGASPWAGDHDAGQVSDNGFAPYSNDVQLGVGVTAPVVEAATTPGEPEVSAVFESVESFILGRGDDEIDASAATGDLTLEGGGGSDTILGGSGDDLIVTGDGRLDSVGGSGVLRNSYHVFRLGHFVDLDPDESNGVSENAHLLLGTHGSAENPLFLQLTRATAHDANGNGRIDDNDWNSSSWQQDSITVDGQTVKMDSTQRYHATVTFTDGTTGAFKAVVFQLQNGQTYLSPAMEVSADAVLLTTKPIASVTIDSIDVDDGVLAALRHDTDFKVMGGDYADGGAGNDTIIGGAGADTLKGGEGDDLIIGGGGADRAVWVQPRSEFRIRYDAETETFTIRDLDAAGVDEGRDVVREVELFEFGGITYTAAQMIAEAARQEAEGAGFEVNLSGGFRVEYFDFDSRVQSLSDIDFDAEPDAREVRQALDFDNGHEAFRDGLDTDTFALRAVGTITVEEGGEYVFRLGADDGAALYVNGVLVADNDGDHGYQNRDGSIMLEPGGHEIEVRYFENFGTQGLKLEWKAPGEADFSLLEADSALATETDAPITLALDVEPGGWAVEGVTLSGLPDGTVLTAGEHVVVAGEGEVDVTGWSFDHLEITPPAGFAGVMSLEVTVTGEDRAGDPAERSSVFEIEVAPPPGGGAGASGEDGFMAGGTDDGWVDAADDDGGFGDDEDVMVEDVDFTDDQGVDGPGFYSHETQEP